MISETVRRFNNSFVSKTDSNENRSILRLDKNQLTIIPIAQTSLFERVQAWFGYGPLNLSNIASYISQNSEELKLTSDSTLTPEDKQRFIRKFSHICANYNQHHFIRKVEMSTLNNLKHAKAFAAIDATYKTNVKGIDDVAYANGIYNFAYVADGTGHDNEMMSKVLNRIFSKFNQKYVTELKEEKKKFNLESQESFTNFVKKQLTELGDAIHNETEPVDVEDPKRPITHMQSETLKPAFSFAQIVKLDDKRLLVSAQFSDTLLLIKKADGSFDISLAKSGNDFGLGNQQPKDKDDVVKRQKNTETTMKVTPLEVGDTVYGFSDGIGEFLTLEECQKIITDNQDPALLLSELKAKIIEKGSNFVQDPSQRNRQDGTKGANGKSLKFHEPNDKHFVDDISMFSLAVD